MENIIFIKKDDYKMTASAFEDDKFQIKNIALQTRDRLSALECKKKLLKVFFVSISRIIYRSTIDNFKRPTRLGFVNKQLDFLTGLPA